MIDASFSEPTKSFIVRPNDEIMYENRQPTSVGHPFQVSSFGITHPSPSYHVERCRTGLDRFGVYVFEYVTKGKGYIECDGIKYTVSAGYFYFLNNTSSHIYYADKTDPYEKKWINLRGSLIKKTLEAYDVTSSVIVGQYDYEKYIDKVQEIYSRPNDEVPLRDKELEASLVVSEMLIRMCDEQSTNALNIDLPLRVKLYIDNPNNIGITVNELAKTFHINTNYLTMCFKAKYGIPPKQYILNRKIDYAKQMLIGSKCEMKEIADTLKFSSVFHFSNTFKKMTNVTPSSYRAGNSK